jgi:hypothetical protein
MAYGRRLTGMFASLLTLAACGSEQPDFQVRDVAVEVRTDAAFTRSADFPARVESTLSAALAYWGGDFHHLAGVTVTFDGAAHVTCGGWPSATGCYDGDIRVSTRDAGVTVSCVEATVLVHEVGHAVIGDASHADPRWMDFETVAASLVGRPGYGAEGPAGCAPAASVWRHPPD